MAMPGLIVRYRQPAAFNLGSILAMFMRRSLPIESKNALGRPGLHGLWIRALVDVLSAPSFRNFPSGTRLYASSWALDDGALKEDMAEGIIREFPHIIIIPNLVGQCRVRLGSSIIFVVHSLRHDTMGSIGKLSSCGIVLLSFIVLLFFGRYSGHIPGHNSVRSPSDSVFGARDANAYLSRRDDYTCSADRPCQNGACCGATGNCGYGSDYCGKGCQSNCNATAECGKHAEPAGKPCPLNTCCSEFGFCGTTKVSISAIYFGMVLKRDHLRDSAPVNANQIVLCILSRRRGPQKTRLLARVRMPDELLSRADLVSLP